jgi:hypothetical protein
MRKAVLCRKVSQQNRSEKGAVTQAVLMSLFRTAELEKKNPVEAALAAQPSMPLCATTTPKLNLNWQHHSFQRAKEPRKNNCRIYGAADS